MRSKAEVQRFAAIARTKQLNCTKCNGTDPACRCSKRREFTISAYESGVPRSFWFINPATVSHNKAVFDKIVVPYVKRLNVALKNGYGLLFTGDNGVGKTYFISYALTQAIRKRRKVYYTTLPQLEHDLSIGMDNKEHRRRLEWYLTSDFLAIDEMGKEKTKSRKQNGNYFDVQLERIIKTRFDNGQPVLLGTNVDYQDLERVYGSTLASMFTGKYQPVLMEPGDMRKSMSRKMGVAMGYNHGV